MRDQFNVSLQDDDLLGEVEMTTNLMVAAAASDVRLSSEAIDRLLGLVH